MIFNDGPEAAPFMASIEVEGNQGGQGGGGVEEQGGKRQLPFEVGLHRIPQYIIFPEKYPGTLDTISSVPIVHSSISQF